MRYFFNVIMLFLFSFTFCFAQGTLKNDFYSPANVLKFADYLFTNGEYQRAATEYERHLFISKNYSDSIDFKIGLCYYFNQQYPISLNKFECFIKANPVNKLWPDAVFYLGYMNYKLSRYDFSISHIEQLLKHADITPVQNDQAQLLLAANQLTLKQWKAAEKKLVTASSSGKYSDAKKNLCNYLEQGQRTGQKNQYFAAALSAVVPGSGKVYAGRPIDGLFSFILFCMTSWQAYDGFSNDKIKSTKGWLFTSIGTIFYMGNIYGSAVSVKVHNQEINDAFNKKIQIELRKVFGH